MGTGWDDRERVDVDEFLLFVNRYISIRVVFSLRLVLLQLSLVAQGHRLRNLKHNYKAPFPRKSC